MKASAVGRLLPSLYEPRKTFESLSARPTWAVAMIVLPLLGTAAVWIAFDRMDPEDFTRQIEEQSGKPLPEGGPDPEAMMGFARWAAIGGSLLGAPLMYSVLALLFWTPFRLLGSALDYRRSLAVTLHGFAPFAVASLAGIPVALSRESLALEELQGGQFLMSHLGFLASEDASATVVALLSSVDLFSIWAIVLLVLGYQVVARVSRAAATTTAGALWAGGILIKVGMAAPRGYAPH